MTERKKNEEKVRGNVKNKKKEDTKREKRR